MMNQVHKLAESYVQSVNRHDAVAYLALFSDDAVVDDAGREFRGLDAIQAWSKSDIFGADVTLDVLEMSREGEVAVITTKVDGTFDRTGLPDPVVIVHRLEIEREKIVGLRCRLATAAPTS